jgi:hypothetical protein
MHRSEYITKQILRIGGSLVLQHFVILYGGWLGLRIMFLCSSKAIANSSLSVHQHEWWRVLHLDSELLSVIGFLNEWAFPFVCVCIGLHLCALITNVRAWRNAWRVFSTESLHVFLVAWSPMIFATCQVCQGKIKFDCEKCNRNRWN